MSRVSSRAKFRKQGRKVWAFVTAICGVAAVATFVTSFFGVRDVLRAGADELDAAAHGSYSSKVRTVGPFLIRVEHGWADGPLSGRGERALYFWFTSQRSGGMMLRGVNMSAVL